MIIPIGATTLIIFLMLAFFAGAYLPYRFGLTQMWEAIPLMRAMHDLLLTMQRKESIVSQALTDKLTELGTEVDEVVSILSTDGQTIETLQSALNAQKAQVPDDSAEIAAAQSLVDKLRTALTPTPAPPSGDSTGTTPPPTGDSGGTDTGTGTALAGTSDPAPAGDGSTSSAASTGDGTTADTSGTAEAAGSAS